MWPAYGSKYKSKQEVEDWNEILIREVVEICHIFTLLLVFYPFFTVFFKEFRLI